jgi:hypothetical protein
MKFESERLADRTSNGDLTGVRVPSYVYLGNVGDQAIYIPNPESSRKSNTDNNALAVERDRIVKIYSAEQIPNLELQVRKFVEQQRKIKEQDIRDREKAARREAEARAAARSNCLTNGKVGVCQNIIDQRRFKSLICRENSLETQLEHCIGGKSDEIVARLEVRNNFIKPIKDIFFKCDHIASSGTKIAESTFVVYKTWQSGQVIDVKFSFVGAPQATKFNCYPVSYDNL